MEIGVGLSMKAIDGEELTTFARKVEDGPFDSISLGQRLTFDSNDPMIALTFAAAVTNRIKLLTSVLCLPFHKEGVLAQQAATLDKLSRGRFSFGLGLGGREADFAAAPEAWPRRGERFEQQLAAMQRIWAGQPPYEGTEPVGPVPFTPGGPEVIIGGYATKALERAGRMADGIRSFSFFTDVDEHMQRYAVVLDAWEKAGRPGRPKLIAATHFALGPGSREIYEAHVAKYYGYNKALMENAMSADAPTSPEAVRSTIKRFGDAGIDHLVFTATTADTIESLDRLAEVVAEVR
jgi:alkanesulfonate monooxygenase SsuD/methylene tetrahydromethanopterin reductase-like flavin-dependent oxidoreductase (luciferase family)